ncbi:LysR family transcriptional regulator [Chitinimonas naiadis]
MRLTQKVAGLEEFIRVAETLSFTRAAESLGLANSAISKAIRELESRLGTRLFYRTTRSVSLTEEGSQLYARATRWMGDLEEMQSLNTAGRLVGQVRIDMPVSIGRSVVMPHLARFLAQHPGISVDVRTNDQHIDLVAEGVDLALRIGDLEASDLIVKPLGRLRLGTYLCPQCLERYGAPLKPSDLSMHRLIAFVLPSGRCKPMFYRRDGEEISIDTSRPVASFNNGEAMRDATIHGMGIAQFPAVHAAEAVRQGLLVPILQGQDAPGPAIQLVYPSRQYQPRRIRVLIDFLAEVLDEALHDEVVS